MALLKEKKSGIIKDFGTKSGDTGSPEVQIALITERVNQLTEHFKTHAKDHHSRQGLLKLVNQRRKLLEYLKKNTPQRYKTILERLALRK
ncbi:MAG: 30S ribosomal protein S15 [candidate division FCPU426 bacterium]